jgi:hypothetical protein
MKDRHDASNGGNGLYDFFDESEAFDGERKQRSRESEPTPNNLTLYKFWGPLPSLGEERDLIRAAQAGDDEAKARLVEGFHRLVLSFAPEFYGPPREELIATGLLGLGEAISAYDLRRNTGFRSYAQAVIRNEIREEVNRYRKRGQHCGTREERLVLDKPGRNTPEAIVAELERRGQGRKKSKEEGLREASQALVRIAGYWDGHDNYDTAERGYDEDDQDTRRSVVAVDVAPVEVHPGGGKVTDDDWSAITAYRKQHSLKPISRSRYTADQSVAHHAGDAQAKLSGLLIEFSALLGMKPSRSPIENALAHRYGLQRLADEIDRREMRRLNEIGRRAYALELVERDRKRIEARANPDNYLYPWVRRAKEAKANPSLKQIKVIKPRKPKRSRVRVWRSADLLAAA